MNEAKETLKLDVSSMVKIQVHSSDRRGWDEIVGKVEYKFTRLQSLTRHGIPLLMDTLVYYVHEIKNRSDSTHGLLDITAQERT